MPFGNVNVDFKPCKSAGQLKAAALYMIYRGLIERHCIKRYAVVF